MSGKTQVFRLKEDEINLIKYIRNTGKTQLAGLLRTFLDPNLKETHKQGIPVIEQIISILDTTPRVTLGDLYKHSVISNDELLFIQSALREEKNIILRGDIGSGIHTFISALLTQINDENPNTKIARSDSGYVEIVSDPNKQLPAYAEYINSEGFSIEILGDVQEDERKPLLVMGDIRTIDHVFAITTAIQLGRQIIAAIPFRDEDVSQKSGSSSSNQTRDIISVPRSDVKHAIKSQLLSYTNDTNIQRLLGSTIDSSSFVVITLSLTEHGRRVVGIDVV